MPWVEKDSEIHIQKRLVVRFSGEFKNVKYLIHSQNMDNSYPWGHCPYICSKPPLNTEGKIALRTNLENNF